MIYKDISSMPDTLLNANDKKARKRQINSLINKIEEEDTSKWDLYNALLERLED